MRSTATPNGYNHYQYYKVVNLTKREYLAGNDFGQGLSYEALLYGDRGVIGATLLLLESSWKGDIIVLATDTWPVGEYEEAMHKLAPNLGKKRATNLYEYAEDFHNAELEARQLATKYGINLNRTLSEHSSKTRGTILDDDDIYVLYTSTLNEYVNPLELGDPAFYVDQVTAGGTGGMLTALLNLISFKDRRYGHTTWATKPLSVIASSQLPATAINITSYLRKQLEESEELIRYHQQGDVITRGVPKYNRMEMITLYTERPISKLDQHYLDSDFIWP